MAQKNKKNYESSDAQFKAIFWAGVALFALILFSFVVGAGLFNIFEGKNEKSLTSRSPLWQARQLPTGPRLQVEPEMDLEHYRALEDSVLNSYGWVQREAGVVHIPVDEAMKQMLQRGFPVRPDYREREIENGASRMEDRGSKMENGGSQK
ncbi:MAG: hypothetical protein ACE5G1_08915 [bacterium]